MNAQEIYDKLFYDLYFEDYGLHIIGETDKVSQHFGDFDGPHTLTVARRQPAELKELVDRYHAENDVSPIKFEDWLAKENII